MSWETIQTNNNIHTPSPLLQFCWHLILQRGSAAGWNGAALSHGFFSGRLRISHGGGGDGRAGQA